MNFGVSEYSTSQVRGGVNFIACSSHFFKYYALPETACVFRQQQKEHHINHTVYVQHEGGYNMRGEE